MGLVTHCDRVRQYLAVRHTRRLAEAGIAPSLVGDALAETVIELVEAEVIRSRGLQRILEAVGSATPEWMHWFDHRRFLGPIGYVPPAEAEARFHAQMEGTATAA